jgi:cobalt-zinc-cadmium efflux system protein
MTSKVSHSHDQHPGHKPEAAHSHGHGHAHGANLRAENKTNMLVVLGLTSAFMICEVVTGLLTGSLALLADAGHMLGDVGAIILALVAIWFSAKPATADKTFGYYRSEILAGFFNALALVAISLYIMYEAYMRLAHPPAVVGLPILVVAVIGLVVNITCLRLLQRSAEQSLNAKAAYLEVLGDCLATAGVIVSSLTIIFFKWYWADPVISGLIAIAILPRTWLLLKECTNILMEGTPGHIDLSALRGAMMAVEGVTDVHDIHVWTITSGLDAMSGHVTIDDRAPAEVILSRVRHIVNDDFGIHHSTIQVEQVECKDSCH